MYSQHGEDKIILQHLENKTGGVILDVGANDGIQYSNSRLFIEQFGWKGVLIEPTSHCINSLKELYKDNSEIEIFGVAIDDEEEEREIYLGTLEGEGINQLSTLSEDDRRYWEDNRGVEYKSEIIKTSTLKSVLSKSAYKNFDIVSIDTEGNDLIVLSQLVNEDIYPKFIILEHNGDKNLLLNSLHLLENRYDSIFQNTVNIILKLR
jgi:FkbM family methyltransferase